MSQSSASSSSFSSARTLAIIGLGGRISQVALNVLKEAGQQLRLIGYADPQPFGLDAIKKAGIDPGQAFVDVDTMLSTLKPDYVMVGSPNHLHLSHIRSALQAGCKVFSEKPVVISPEQTWEAAELLANYGQDNFLVGLVLRSSPLFQKVMDLIDQGRIGKPVSMEANEVLGPEHGGFLMRDWRRFREFAGSHILEKCCHDIDLHQAVLGSRIVRSASFGGRNIFTAENEAELAKTNPDGKERYQQWRGGWNSLKGGSVFTSDGDIIDNQVIIAECENGTRLTFHVNNHNAFGQRRWMICGHQGAIESDLADGSLTYQGIYADRENLSLDNSGNGGHYGADEAMAKDLVATWFTNKPFPVPTKAALEAGLAAMLMDQAQTQGIIADGNAWMQRLDAILAPAKAAAHG